MSDSDESFNNLRDINRSSPTTLKHSRKRVTDSINCEELAAASADVEPEQPPVSAPPGPSPQQELDWCIPIIGLLRHK